jgi:hypothetical protein
VVASSEIWPQPRDTQSPPPKYSGCPLFSALSFLVEEFFCQCVLLTTKSSTTSLRAKSILARSLLPNLWPCIRRACRTALRRYIARPAVVDNIVERTETDESASPYVIRRRRQKRTHTCAIRLHECQSNSGKFQSNVEEISNHRQSIKFQHRVQHIATE